MGVVPWPQRRRTSSPRYDASPGVRPDVSRRKSCDSAPGSAPCRVRHAGRLVDALRGADDLDREEVPGAVVAEGDTGPALVRFGDNAAPEDDRQRVLRRFVIDLHGLLLQRVSTRLNPTAFRS